jgi:hypothetical protein
MLQAGRSRVPVPMRWIFFFNLPNPSSRNMALESTQPLTDEYQEYSCERVKGGRCVKLMIALPPSVSRLSREYVGASMSHNSMGLHGLLQGYSFTFYLSRDNRLFSTPQLQYQLWGPPRLRYNGCRKLFPRGQSGRCVKLTTHHLIQRSRMVELYFQLAIRLHGMIKNGQFDYKQEIGLVSMGWEGALHCFRAS